MGSEDILKVLCDYIHYPDFNNAWEKLNSFEQNQLMQCLDDVINEAYQDGYEECEAEERDSFDSGYERGTKAAMQVIKRFVNDEELLDKIENELPKDED